MAKVKILPPMHHIPQPWLPAHLLASLLDSFMNSLSFATLVSWFFLKPKEHTPVPCLDWSSSGCQPAWHSPCFPQASAQTPPYHNTLPWPPTNTPSASFLCRGLLTIQYGCIWLFTTNSDTTGVSAWPVLLVIYLQICRIIPGAQ